MIGLPDKNMSGGVHVLVRLCTEREGCALSVPCAYGRSGTADIEARTQNYFVPLIYYLFHVCDIEMP